MPKRSRKRATRYVVRVREERAFDIDYMVTAESPEEAEAKVRNFDVDDEFVWQGSLSVVGITDVLSIEEEAD